MTDFILNSQETEERPETITLQTIWHRSLHAIWHMDELEITEVGPGRWPWIGSEKQNLARPSELWSPLDALFPHVSWSVLLICRERCLLNV
jgi:hypothetical protein